MKNNSSLYIRLKFLRKQRKITQEELANNLHLSRAQVYRYEKGIAAPDPDIIVRLATFFEVSVDYLLKGEETNLFASDDLDAKLSPLYESLYLTALELDTDTQSDFITDIQEYINYLKSHVYRNKSQ